MAAYVQLGCGFPSANQFVTGASLTTSASSASPLDTLHRVPSISSPSIGNDSAASGASGMLTPDPASQTSTAGTTSLVTGGGGGSSADSGSSPYVCAASDASTAPPSSCTDSGCCVLRDPVSGHTVCSSEYDPARLTLSGYTRLQSAVYGAPYQSGVEKPYPSISADGTPFYTSLSNPYGLKENSTAAGSDVASWTSASLQPAAGYYSYDPTFGAYGYGAATYDLAARRKNTTRESTSTLKAWLSEHKKNPYPTKGEKIMLAIITKMTLTQVSTWFANARRRLKKENKMTWEPKTRTEDDDGDGDDGDADDDNDAAAAALPSDEEERERQKDRIYHNEMAKRHGFGANLVVSVGCGGAGGTGGGSTAAGADVAATASVARVGGTVGSHSAGTNSGPGTGPDRGTDVGEINSEQPKVPFQLHYLQQQPQYSQHFYYNNSSNSHHQQQQQQYQQFHQQQTAISALSQHVANSTLLQQHQQQHVQPNRFDRQ